MLKKNDTVTVTVTDMTFDGSGIGKIALPEGDFPVFVRAAAVGDTVECRIVKVQRRYAAAVPLRIVTPSPDRIEPGCPVAGKCGGCAFRHVTYESELRYKTESVRNAYRLNAPDGIVIRDCVPSPVPDGYRNKLQLPCSPAGKFGFYAPYSHRVLPCDSCAAGHPAMIPFVRATEAWIAEHSIPPYDENAGTGLIRHLYLRRGYHSGQVMVCLALHARPDTALPAALSDWAKRMTDLGAVSVYLNFNPENTNVILGKSFRLLAGEPTICDTMNGVSFRISPPSFYQINTPQAEAIYAAAASYLSPDDDLLDLYCGIGTVGLCCAKSVRRVVGVEVIPEAVEDAKHAAEENGIKNASFYAADASDVLSVLDRIGYRPTAVVVDPPRKGLSPETVSALKTLAPRKIVYISCDPATQARDVRLLSDLYTPGAVQPYDLFPRTAHVETVVMMSKR